MNNDGDLYGQTIEWRETMRNPSFFLLDGYFALFLPLFLFHIRWWSFVLLLTAALAFTLMRIFRYRPASALRAIRSALAGPSRPARFDHFARTALDFGFEYRNKS